MIRTGFPQRRPGSGPDPNPMDPDRIRIRRIRIQESKKLRIRLHIFFLYWYFIPLFVRLRFSRKVFAKNFREKLTKFRENCGTFRKSFRERSKKFFRPNPSCHPLFARFLIILRWWALLERTLLIGRVSCETSVDSKQPKLEPKLGSILSETRCLFRLFWFYIETAFFGVSIEPKQNKNNRNKPKKL
jgi:hypothetical protein